MNPILKYLKNILSFSRVIGDDKQLSGLQQVDALLSGLITEHKAPGIAISVLKEGKAIFQKGYGYSNLEHKIPINPSTTIFRIASVSKPIAATALAHMVSEKIIDLDASFYTYVPYFPKKKWDFTIRQLASHTAGIRSYKGKEFALNKSFSIKESIAVFKDDPLLFEPGNGYEYNTYDWVLISLAMQEASGVPFEVYVKDKVLTPLGMTNTFTPKESEPNKTIFYTKNKFGFREAISVNNFYKLAGGGYLSTTEDIAKLGQAYLNEYPLDLTLLSQFLTSVNITDKPTYYGLGWQVSEDKLGRPYFGHIGSSVGAYSNFFVYPKEQMVFTIVINCTDPKIQETLDAVIAIFLKEINTTDV